MWLSLSPLKLPFFLLVVSKSIHIAYFALTEWSYMLHPLTLVSCWVTTADFNVLISKNAPLNTSLRHSFSVILLWTVVINFLVHTFFSQPQLFNIIAISKIPKHLWTSKSCIQVGFTYVSRDRITISIGIVAALKQVMDMQGTAYVRQACGTQYSTNWSSGNFFLWLMGFCCF